MKRVFLLIAMLVTVACSKAPKTQDVVFRASFVETGSMTRATDHDEILNLIAGPLLVKLAENGRFTSKLRKKKCVTH